MKAQTVPVLTIEIVVHIESRLNQQLSTHLCGHGQSLLIRAVVFVSRCFPRRA